jgi:excisionase family DNA binding protein
MKNKNIGGGMNARVPHQCEDNPKAARKTTRASTRAARGACATLTPRWDTSLPRAAFSMAETAEILGVSYITVHRLLRRGVLRSSKALRCKLISAEEINRFLKETAE